MENSEFIKLILDNAKILNVLRCNNYADRNMLCEAMGLSWPTIQKSIEQLKTYGIVESKVFKKDSGEAKIGEIKDAKREEFTINASVGYYVGISVGGSQIKMSMVDMKFHALEHEKFFGEFIEKYNLFKGPEQGFKRSTSKDRYGYLYVNTPPSDFGMLQEKINYIIGEIVKLNDKLNEKGTLILGIGFAFTGAVDNQKKEIRKSFSLDCFNNLPIKYDSLIYPEKVAYFASKNINIIFENIARAALVSEKFALYNSENPSYIYKNRKNVACMYLGSGVGNAFIFNNTLYRGASNFSELGHIDIIDPEVLPKCKKISNQVCTCGSANCLEHKIRKNVFGMEMNEFREYTSTDLKNKLLDYDDKEDRLKCLAFYLNQAIKIMTNLLNLDLIILTGKLTKLMDELGKYLYNEKSNNPVSYINADCSLVTSGYGALAPSLGAAMLSAFGENIEEIEWY